ncbi:MAG: hypothetical protein KBE91_02770 [Bacteroidia bacterium]|nr:hypothetical protein [Bacteroidia bacterium]
MKINNTLKYLIILSPYLLLTLVCILNLSWNITDHDDGHTLGFHNMGRNPDIQRSYGAYDSMCDYLLGFLPINYKILLGFMVGATILSAYAILYYAGNVLKQWFNFTAVEIGLGQLLFLLAMPEFIYMVFSFKSVYISLAFILVSTNILFKDINSNKYLIISALLFGLGVSFRWNMIIMGAPIAAILIWEIVIKNNWGKALFKAAIWGILALILSLVFIYISGYSPQRMITEYIWGKAYMVKTDFQLIARIGDLSLFFTPTTALLFMVGIVYLIKNKNTLGKFSVLFTSTFLAVAIITIAPSFKFLAPLWISFIALFIFAIKYTAQLSKNWQKTIITLTSIALFSNWFVGLQIDTPSSNWGPGLNVKTEIASLNVFDKNLRTDDRFKLENIKIGFFDGFCLPTSEGMRPLYGHFYALFGRKLHTLDEKLNRETDTVLNAASIHHQIIYQDRVNPYLLASYLRLGYRTTDNWQQKNTDYSRRMFTNGSDTITEIRVNIPKNLFDIEKFKEQITITDTVYTSFTYTSALNKFLHNWETAYHGHYKKMGPQSAKIWQ